MISWVFIEFFGVKIVIGLSKKHRDLILTVGFDLSQNSRYIFDISDILPIYLRYLIDISPIFTYIFPAFLAHAHMRYSLEISPKYRKFPKFRRNIWNFRYFADISPIFMRFFRFFSYFLAN